MGEREAVAGTAICITLGCGEAIVKALVRAGTQKSPSAAQLDAER